MDKASFCLFLAFESTFRCCFRVASILIATIFDVIIESDLELFKFLSIIKVIVIQNPELVIKLSSNMNRMIRISVEN